MAPVASAFTRLDDLVKDEKNAKDVIAEELAFHLYGKHYDQLPADLRSRVEGATFRALRAPQGVWSAHAVRRAHVAAERAMAREMGPEFGMQAPEARQAKAGIFIQAVLSALIGVLEVERPFNGSGDALKVYEAAETAAQVIREGRK